MQVSYIVPPFSTNDCVREREKKSPDQSRERRNKNKQHTHVCIHPQYDLIFR